MRDHRKLERKALIHHLRVLHRKTRQIVGYVGNITPKGLLVFSGKPVRRDPKGPVPLQIVLPSDMGEECEIACDAARVWSQKDASRALYAAGFQIKRIAPEDVRLIAATVARFGSQA